MAAFRDQLPDFDAADAQVLGVSMDDLDTQKRFAESLELPFPLLADPEGKAARAYGVAAENYAKRVTFVIAPDGTVKAVFEGSEALDPAGALGACRAAAP